MGIPSPVGLISHRPSWVRWLRELPEVYKNNPEMPTPSTVRVGTHNRDSQGYPSTLITTSRRPTPRIRTLSNNLSCLLPRSIRVTRGKLSLREVAERTAEKGCNRLVVLDRWKKGACKISFYSIDSKGLEPHSPQIYVRRFVTHLERREKGSRIRVARSIVLSSNSESVRRLAVFLSRFLGLNLMTLDRIQDLREPFLIVSSTANGRIRIYARSKDFPEDVPSLYVARLVWNETEVQV